MTLSIPQTQPVQGAFTEQSSLSAGSLNADLVTSTDVSAYKSFCVHINTNAYSGTLTFQCSNDNVNWVSLNVSQPGFSNLVTNTSATNVMFYQSILFRYLRIRMTSYTSGAAQGTLELYTTAAPPQSNLTAATQSGTWTIQPGNTANTTPWLSAPGNNNASVASGAGNTVIKASKGQLVAITVTTNGTGAGNVLIYDNATTNSGTVLYAFPATITVPTNYLIYMPATTGITVANVLNGPVFTVGFS